MSTITGVVKAAVDWCHFLLLKEDGTVLSWGYYDNSSAARNMTPFVYEGATNVVDVYAGSPFCVLLKSDNTCVSVVNPYYGDYVSKDVTDLTVQLRTADGYLEQMFNVATDGSVTARGYNDYNQLGIDKSMTGLFMPELTLVPYLSDVVKISTSQDHALALCEDGTVWTWGRNHVGQLGLGDIEEREIPMPLTQLNNHRDGSTYEKAYILTENSAYAPADYSCDNWFEFTPPETGDYFLEGVGDYYRGAYLDAFFYTVAEPNADNYSGRWSDSYIPQPFDGPLRYHGNSYFYFERTLTAGQKILYQSGWRDDRKWLWRARDEGRKDYEYVRYEPFGNGSRGHDTFTLGPWRCDGRISSCRGGRLLRRQSSYSVRQLSRRQQNCRCIKYLYSTAYLCDALAQTAGIFFLGAGKDAWMLVRIHCGLTAGI